MEGIIHGQKPCMLLEWIISLPMPGQPCHVAGIFIITNLCDSVDEVFFKMCLNDSHMSYFRIKLKHKHWFFFKTCPKQLKSELH